ncbi:MAG: hypothetical protein CL695_04925 [Chloroflexi bacterium]|nr:hypothetical protein [Chloroflexota bacterium]
MTEVGLRERWNFLSRGTQRIVIALAISLDACLGLLYDFGSLNLIDTLLFDNLPTDLIWLLQTLQLIGVGFVVVKVFFDDLPDSTIRTILIITSPLLLIVYILFSLHVLLLGQDLVALVTLDLGSLTTSTLTWSSTYLAIAVGCTLTYSVQRYGNFAQSEFFMLGMYVGIALMWTDWLFPLSEAPADGTLVWSLFLYVLIAAFILTGFAGIIIDRLVFKGFRDRKSSSDIMMIASLGVAMVLRALVYLRFGANSKRLVPDADWMLSEQRWEIPTITTRFSLGTSDWPLFEYGVTNYAYNNGFLPIVVFSTVILLFLLLTRTRLGRRMRAVADNPELAASSGINVEGVQATSAFLSAGISGIGGAVFGLTVLFNPQTAFTLLLPAFAVIILGTIGSVPGAIGASLIIGFVRAVSEPVLSGIGNPLERTNYFALSGVMPYAIIIAILLIMPEGIGNAYDKWKIERLRKRAASTEEPNSRSSALMGLLFGWAGGHHFHQRRTARGVSMLILTVLSFSLAKATSFMRDRSFVGQKVTTAPDGLDSSMHADWLNLIHNEQTIIGTLASLGDLLWPLLPILIYCLALYESYLILNNRYKDPLQAPITRIMDTVDAFSTKIGGIFVTVSESRQASFYGICGLLALLTALLSQSVLVEYLAYLTALAALGMAVWWPEQQRNATSGNNKPLEYVNQSISFLGTLTTEKVKKIKSNFYEKIGAEYGVESESGSKAMFWILLGILTLVVIWLPSVSYFGKVLQVSNFIVTLSIFLILAYSLNLHTGMTGLLNFGIIFFAAVGAIVVGILTAPGELYGYDWPILPALIVAIIIGAIFGWLLAYPTARLRSDYFAIITISLGEIVRLLLMGEPLLRAGGNRSAIGIQRYPLPLREWWFCGSDPPLTFTGDKLSPVGCSTTSGIDSMAVTVGDIIGLGQPAPYMLLLAIIGLLGVAFTWKLLNLLFESPWGRILRSIREDEEVAQHHGHDILKYKAASLAFGAGIAAFAGALWAWKLTGFQPSFMSPAKSTFLVWAAFIIGGAANNRGMLIGAMIITLTEFFFNVLVAAQGSSSLPLSGFADLIDETFMWLVESPFQVAAILMFLAIIGAILRNINTAETLFWFSAVFIICGVIFDQRSIDLVFPEILGGIETKMAYVKLMLIGLLITVSLKYNPKGMLPEVPYRPARPKEVDSE